MPRLADGILWLCGFGMVGLAVELAFARHWRSVSQDLVWVALALVAVAWSALVRARGSDTAGALTARRRASWLAVLVALSSVIGVWLHVAGNFDAGPLDAVFGDRWAGMTEAARWWAAITTRVGPAPTLAPGALALLAGMVWLVAEARPDGR